MTAPAHPQTLPRGGVRPTPSATPGTERRGVVAVFLAPRSLWPRGPRTAASGTLHHPRRSSGVTPCASGAPCAAAVGASACGREMAVPDATELVGCGVGVGVGGGGGGCWQQARPAHPSTAGSCVPIGRSGGLRARSRACLRDVGATAAGRFCFEGARRDLPCVCPLHTVSGDDPTAPILSESAGVTRRGGRPARQGLPGQQRDDAAERGGGGGGAAGARGVLGEPVVGPPDGAGGAAGDGAGAGPGGRRCWDANRRSWCSPAGAPSPTGSRSRGCWGWRWGGSSRRCC